MATENQQKSAALFGLFLLHESTNAHILHWTTQSWSQHQALGELYAGLEEKADEYLEAYMGSYDQLKVSDFPDFFELPNTDAVSYVDQLANTIATIRKTLPQDTELQNIVDEVASMVEGVLYKLKFLK